MRYTESEVLDFIYENDVKFSRLCFCDAYGVQRNLSVLPAQLAEAFASGVPVDAALIGGFGGTEGELLLRPDPSTLALLPWRPSHGRVVRFFCGLWRPDGTPFPLDGRFLLQGAVKALEEAGLRCQMGAECEFYLFQTDETGAPTRRPFDEAGYMGIAPKDKGENIRREICLTLEEMELAPLRSQHKGGPGQNEIDFAESGPLSSADNVVTFQFVVRTTAARNGLFASFAPKPLPTCDGSGFHIWIGPRAQDGGDRTDAFMAGILRHICEITAFLNPAEASYARLGTGRAPGFASWSEKSGTQLVRRVRRKDGPWIEVRSPDCAANPYLAYTLLLYAGLSGVRDGLRPGAPWDGPGAPQGCERLPVSFAQAASLARESAFVRACLPKELLAAYAAPLLDEAL